MLLWIRKVATTLEELGCQIAHIFPVLVVKEGHVLTRWLLLAPCILIVFE